MKVLRLGILLLLVLSLSGGRACAAAVAARALMFAALALSLPAAPAADAMEPGAAISYLNQQRAAYGIPPVTLDQSLLKPECNLANHEIASPRTSWSTTSSPWDEAPYHELILYDPSDVRASYGEYNGFGSEGGTWACMWFAHDWDANPAFYWSAEATGPHSVPPSLSAFEAPSTPAEDAGLSNPTGPNLAVYAQGISGEPTPVSASVTSAGGATVPVHLVPFTFNGSVVVVDHPLSPATLYHVVVQWRGEGIGEEGERPVEYAQRFDFTTAFAAPARVQPRLGLQRLGRSRIVEIEADELLQGRTVSFGVTVKRWRCHRRGGAYNCRWRRARTVRRMLQLGRRLTPVRVPRPGHYTAVLVWVKSAAFVSGSDEVAAASARLILR